MAIAAICLVAGALSAASKWSENHALMINVTDSLPNWAFVVEARRFPVRGDYVVFHPGHDPITVKYFGAKPAAFTKIALGLPGDTVTRIAGAFSGTLGFVMTGLQAGEPFSAVVREAHRLGYTEPDPRDDLGGLDVARKALILARGLGWRMEMSDIQVRGLYPPEMGGLTVAEFLQALPQLDADFRDRVQTAAEAGKVLRYAATVENECIRVGLTAVDAGSPLGRRTAASRDAR